MGEIREAVISLKNSIALLDALITRFEDMIGKFEEIGNRRIDDYMNRESHDNMITEIVTKANENLINTLTSIDSSLDEVKNLLRETVNVLGRVYEKQGIIEKKIGNLANVFSEMKKAYTTLERTVKLNEPPPRSKSRRRVSKKRISGRGGGRRKKKGGGRGGF